MFGLGGSGVASASALLAGGADVIGWDDDAETRGQGGERRHSDRRSATASTGRELPRWCWRPGVPLTHPAPHWPVGLARARRRRGDRRHRAVLPGAAQSCSPGAVRRHHRHQWEIDDHRAYRASRCASPAMMSQLGGNIGTAILSLEPPRAGRGACRSKSRPIKSTLRRPSIRRSVSSSMSPRIISTATARLRDYAAIKERLVAGVPGGRHRDRRGRRQLVPGRRRPHRACRQAGDAGLGAPAARRTGSMWRPNRSCRLPAAARARSRILGGIGSLRGLHNAQNAACAAARGACARPVAGDHSGRIAIVSGPGAPAWNRSGARVACCSSTIPRRRMPIRPRRRWPVSPISSGSPAAGRRPAASPRLQASSRASARPI